MQLQMELWPETQENKQTKLWRQFKEKDRQKIVHALAQAMRKAVSDPIKSENEEESNEQQSQN